MLSFWIFGFWGVRNLGSECGSLFLGMSHERFPCARVADSLPVNDRQVVIAKLTISTDLWQGPGCLHYQARHRPMRLLYETWGDGGS